jgi:glycosyltransferase involved in cell wall biosynthesis
MIRPVEAGGREANAQLVRVLVVHPRDPAAPTLGGIQTFMGDFIKYAPQDFEISFVGTSRDLDARPLGRWLTIEIRGRKVRFLAAGPSAGVSRSPGDFIRSLLGLARLWNAVRVRDRILQVHRPYRRLFLDRHRGSTVQFIHLDIRDWPGPQGWPRLRSLYREFSDETLERMDRVFIVNETGADILRADHPQMATRVEFLPVWYDADVFKPVTDESRAALRRGLAERLGMSADAADRERFVLLAARLTEIKKPLLAIETLAEEIRRGRSEVHLIVAGSGELLDDAQRRAEVLRVGDRVHFVGDVARAELAELMQASDALILTARAEGGGPRVVLEALACGLPVVSTKVVEVKRTVTSGVNGWLVDEPSPAALADGLEWAFSQDHAFLARAAVASVAAFTAEQVLHGLYATYRELASPARAVSQ